MEENAQQKFETLKEQILEAQYDVICFQEVNQEMGSEAVETDEYYQALPSSVAIHKDHFVRVLVEELAAQGLHYYWTWAYNHIGYDHLNEGVAVLSRQPLKADEILVSNMDDPTDYHTREWPLPIQVWMAKRLLLPASIFLGGTKVSNLSGHALRTTSAK